MKKFDYIICGAGAAGCVLANRLSQNPDVSVLLIEAGPGGSGLMTKMPRGFAKLLLNEEKARFFQTGPDDGVKPQGETWLRGRMLGGSSSVNGMLYFHGNPADFDGWRDQGNEGWGWDTIGPIYKKIEDHALGSGEARGTGGPVKVCVNRHHSPLMDAVIAAGRQLGLPKKEDLNEPDQDGIGYTTFNIDENGERSGSAQAFLHPVMERENLTVLTETLVSTVLFEGGRAAGIECERRGQRERFHASREVILACGALQTPQVLELSGVGDADRLARLGIPLVKHSPGVGENLREHCLIIMQRRLKVDWSANKEFSGWRLYKNVLSYLLFRKGPMAYSGFDVSGFARCGADATRPDVHLIASRTSMDLGSWDGWTKGPTLETSPGMQLMGYPTSPRSKGSVHIRSADPSESPEIKANYHCDEYDRHVSVNMFRYMRDLLSQPVLKDIVGEETIPGEQVQTDEEILGAFAKYSGPGYHACGTARMGNDDMAVVDERLRVHGVSGLRVCDISIFPTQTAGNTNAPAMAAAWKAADMIIEDQEK